MLSFAAALLTLAGLTPGGEKHVRHCHGAACDITVVPDQGIRVLFPRSSLDVRAFLPEGLQGSHRL
jgi:hypothetical protein